MNPIHIVVPITLIIAYIGLGYLWNQKYRPRAIQRGKATDKFARSFSRLWSFIFTDKTPLIPKVQHKFFKKFVTWSSFSYASMLAIIVVFIFNPMSAWIPALVFVLPVMVRAPQVLSKRQQKLLRMLAVANATFHYGRGAEMDPWSHINVKKWETLVDPGETIIDFPPAWSASYASQDAFETHFSQTVTEENTWTYKWDVAKGLVTMKPVGHIPNKAPYPGSTNRPWNEIPLGLGAEGEIIWDVSVAPHAGVFGKSGGGKDLSVNTQVIIRKNTGKNAGKWIKTTLKNVEVGDQIHDEKGNPTTVTHLHPIVTPEKAYKVIFSSGEELIVDPEHLWYTETEASRSSTAMAKHKDKHGLRKNTMLLSDGAVKFIEQVIENTGDDETISIPETAELIGKNRKTSFIETIAKIIGPAEEELQQIKFYYGAQTVTQKQELWHYNSAEFMKAYNSRPLHRTQETPLKSSEVAKLRQLKLEVRSSDKLYAKNISEYLGCLKSDIAKKWIQTNYANGLDELIAAAEALPVLGDLPDQIHSIDKEYINNHEFASIVGKNSNETQATFLRYRDKVSDKYKEKVDVDLLVSEKTVSRTLNPVVKYPKKMMLEQILAHAETNVGNQEHKRARGSVKTTQEIFETVRVENNLINHSIDRVKTLQFPEQVLPIAPYSLGAWLGDGYSRNGDICGEDHEVFDEIEKEGYAASAISRSREVKHYGVVTNSKFRIVQFGQLAKVLEQNNMLVKPGNSVARNGYVKYIPTIYLTSSETQRRALLSGLMDTDGTVNKDKGSVSLTTVIPQLRDDFVELVRGLGYTPVQRTRPHTKQDGTVGNDSYDIQFVPNLGDKIFRIPRKQIALEESLKTHLRDSTVNRIYITDVVEVEPVPMRCISVDSPSRLFVVGEGLIPTHNSVAQRNIVFHVIQHNDKWCLLGVDPKKVELKPYAKYKNTVMGIGTTLEDMVEIIRYAKEEMMSRYETMEELEVNNFNDLPNPPRAILVMIDEAYMLMAPTGVKTDQGKEDDQLHGEATVLIGEILRLGRAAGVHIALAMQRPDATVLKGEFKNNLEMRIVAGRYDSTASAMALDNGLASRVPNIKGRGVAQANGDGKIYQGYFAPQSWIDDWIMENPEREPEVYAKLKEKAEMASPSFDIPEDFSDLSEYNDNDIDDNPVTQEDELIEMVSLSKTEDIEDAILDISRIDDPSDFLPENAGRENDIIEPKKIKMDKASTLQPEDVSSSLYHTKKTHVDEDTENDEDDFLANLMKIMNDEPETDSEPVKSSVNQSSNSVISSIEETKPEQAPIKAPMPAQPITREGAPVIPTRSPLPKKPLSPSIDNNQVPATPSFSLPPRTNLPPR
jgi:hypothetical protein